MPSDINSDATSDSKYLVKVPGPPSDNLRSSKRALASPLMMFSGWYDSIVAIAENLSRGFLVGTYPYKIVLDKFSAIATIESYQQRERNSGSFNDRGI